MQKKIDFKCWSVSNIGPLVVYLKLDVTWLDRKSAHVSSYPHAFISRKTLFFFWTEAKWTSFVATKKINFFWPAYLIAFLFKKIFGSSKWILWEKIGSDWVDYSSAGEIADEPTALQLRFLRNLYEKRWTPAKRCVDNLRELQHGWWHWLIYETRLTYVYERCTDWPHFVGKLMSDAHWRWLPCHS